MGAYHPEPLYLTEKADRFVIAADRGWAALARTGIRPDLAVGDFDSLGYVPEHPNLLRYPAEKDDTDMMLAARSGLRQGLDTFVLFGGLGGRLDHTLANLQTLSFLAEQGARGYLMGKDCVVTAIRDGAISFGSELRGELSVFCLGEAAHGVDILGLQYEMRQGELKSTFPVGVSNAFRGQPGTIAVAAGTLTILWHEDRAALIERLGSGWR